MEVSDLSLATGSSACSPGAWPTSCPPSFYPLVVTSVTVRGPASWGRAGAQNCILVYQCLHTVRRKCFMNPRSMGEVHGGSGRGKAKAVICRLLEPQLRQNFSFHGRVSCAGAHRMTGRKSRSPSVRKSQRHPGSSDMRQGWLQAALSPPVSFM